MRCRTAVVTTSAVLLLCAVQAFAAQKPQADEPAAVNAHASPEARALLHYLQSISGRFTLTGQHNYPYTIARWSDRAYDFTGRYPALFGQDLGFAGGDDKDSIEARPAIVAEALRQYRSGAIVTLMWHAVRPTDDEPVTFHGSVQGKLTDFEWRELTTPGTHLYARWCAQVDVIASYLKQLQAARVPVLWRPYHEVNGPWFWWGGRPGNDGSAALYRQLFERLVNHHKLDNLVWVWNANAPGTQANGAGPYADFFPGLEYVDVLATDVYGEFAPSHYNGLLALAQGKPIALGEVGAAPTPAILRQQPRWAWFMVWSEILESANSIEGLRAVFQASMTLSRDDVRLAQPLAAMRAASAPAGVEPVTAGASPEVVALLARLHATSGQHTLSGQENAVAAPASARVRAVTARDPVVWAAELGNGAARAVLDEAQRQHQAGAVVSLSYRPARPTDDEGASVGTRAAMALSDFEWRELLDPTTRLHARWCAQVDAAAASLAELQAAGIAVLWRPYPRSNAKGEWWGGRSGTLGSAALYRQLYERLVDHAGLHNLIWVWEAAPAGFGPDAPGAWSTFSPRLDRVDAFAVDVEDAQPGWHLDGELARFAVGKPVGLRLGASVPAPALFSDQPRWAWFVLAPDAVFAPDAAEALTKLYGDPRIVTGPATSAAPRARARR